MPLTGVPPPADGSGVWPVDGLGVAPTTVGPALAAPDPAGVDDGGVDATGTATVNVHVPRMRWPSSAAEVHATV